MRPSAFLRARPRTGRAGAPGRSGRGCWWPSTCLPQWWARGRTVRRCAGRARARCRPGAAGRRWSALTCRSGRHLYVPHFVGDLVEGRVAVDLVVRGLERLGLVVRLGGADEVRARPTRLPADGWASPSAARAWRRRRAGCPRCLCSRPCPCAPKTSTAANPSGPWRRMRPRRAGRLASGAHAASFMARWACFQNGPGRLRAQAPSSWALTRVAQALAVHGALAGYGLPGTRPSRSRRGRGGRAPRST